jgi:hypothetical protein
VPSATGTITIHVDGQEKLGRLAGRLRQAAGGGLRRNINDGLTKSGNAALQAVRGAFKGVNITGEGGGGGLPSGSTGLRARVAAATMLYERGDGLQYRTHVDRVDGRYGGTLTHGVNGTRWRHPTFGRPPWTGEVGEEVFFSTLRRFHGVWQAGIQRGMDATARDIAG